MCGWRRTRIFGKVLFVVLPTLHSGSGPCARAEGRVYLFCVQPRPLPTPSSAPNPLVESECQSPQAIQKQLLACRLSRPLAYLFCVHHKRYLSVSPASSLGERQAKQHTNRQPRKVFSSSPGAASIDCVVKFGNNSSTTGAVRHRYSK